MSGLTVALGALARVSLQQQQDHCMDAGAEDDSAAGVDDAAPIL